MKNLDSWTDQNANPSTPPAVVAGVPETYLLLKRRRFEPGAKQDVVTVPALGLSLENAREASAADNNIRPGGFDMDQRRDLAAR
ncbi:hypothetical protein [Phyllobacterium chamaecytisi]|uniref:hypothetical protein n=1 Tax=Phyllobacterium chamaecytisi TaxID=2876082 RepID=UPI001CCA2C40|nr:hypothetical protein [Phyllobacterium sp. KW56]MBZ9605495.1 hypothetical protein [Phyllobacterium sp. KW56]